MAELLTLWNVTKLSWWHWNLYDLMNLSHKDNSRKFLLLPACSKTQDMGCLWQMLQCTHMRPSLLHLQTIEDCHKNLAMSTWPKYFECVGHRRITRETGHSSEAGQQTSFQCYLLLLGSASALPRSLLLINHSGYHDVRKVLLWTKDRYKLGTGN